jgi:2-dehydropantoate 2-reductase
VTDLVVGGGAVGSLLALSLAAGGRDVAIVRRGLERPSRSGEVALADRDGPVRIASVTEVRSPGDLPGAPELIVFGVKMFDLEAAVQSCAAWPGSTSLTPGNGIGAEEVVGRLRPVAGLIAGSVTVSVDARPDGRLVRLNRGGIGLAAVTGEVEPTLSAVAAALSAGGLRVRRYDDAAAMKWSKLVANLVGNATSAICDLPPGAIYADPRGFDVEREQLREAFAVMGLSGLAPVALPGADVRLLAAAIRLPPALGRPILGRVVAAGRGGKDPSLRIHARDGSGESEVAWLNGAVARAAAARGGSARVNARLAELVATVIVDEDRRSWLRGRPDRLADAILGD